MLPYSTFKIETDKSKKEAIKLIVEKTIIGKFDPFDPQLNGKLFHGTFGTDTFQVRRFISYHNSFQPIFMGQVVDDEEKCRINVKIWLSPIIVIFGCILLLGAAGTLFSVFTVLEPNAASYVLGLFVLTLFGIVPSVLVASYVYDAKAGKKEIITLLKEKIDNK